MSPEGFLTDAWRDLITVVGFIGTLATLVGLSIAVVQVLKTKRATEAAQAAMSGTLQQAKSAVGQYAMSSGRRLLSEAKLFFEAGNWSGTALRLGDLAEQAAQLAQSDPSNAAQWDSLRSRFREWETTCLRLDKGELRGSQMAKWYRFTRDAAALFDSDHGPFPAMRDPNE